MGVGEVDVALDALQNVDCDIGSAVFDVGVV